ncbi:MAG: hypothetical protein J6A38_04125 [Clostridia bacterium]|nr:hypothetical protein [Clostridia bacterium]
MDSVDDGRTLGYNCVEIDASEKYDLYLFYHPTLSTRAQQKQTVKYDFIGYISIVKTLQICN